MSTSLTPEQMKTFVRRHFEDFVNHGRPEVIRANMTPDFVDHDGPDGARTGIAGDEAMMRAMHARIPDLRVTIEEMVAEGDMVVCRNVWRWKDERKGRMEFRGFVQWRFEGEKIAERWACVSPPQIASSGHQ